MCSVRPSRRTRRCVMSSSRSPTLALELRPDVAVVGGIAACAAGSMLLLLTAPIPIAWAIALALAAGCTGIQAARSQRFGCNRRSLRALILTGEADWILEFADRSQRPAPAPVVAARVIRWWYIRWPGGWAVVTARSTDERSWRRLTARLREQAHGSATPHAVSSRG